MLPGLWKRKDDLHTFTVITTDSNELTADVHDRMPVIIDNIDRDLWLDHERNKDELLALLKPFDSGVMRMDSVDRRVGSVRNNDAACVEVVSL